MPRFFSKLHVALLLSLLLAGASFAQNPVTYIYDETGRLVGVVDPVGNAAAYKYDATGNLMSISRYSPSQVAIIDFTPNSGPVGSTVTVKGSGFSSTPGQNTVKFNGVSATVMSSTSTQIVASVPSGATSGTIAVTSSVGSATSTDSFTVASSSSAPSISGFTPSVGSGGGTLTVSGSNFSTTTSNDKVKLNVGFAPVSSATATSLSLSIPTAATSGRITVMTPGGTAVSTGDFFVSPPGQLVASNATGRMNIGDTASISVPGGGWAGLMIFDATAMQRISLSYTDNSDCGFFSVNGDSLGLLDPYGNYTWIPGCDTGGGFVDATTLLFTGTYSIFMVTQAGSLTFTLTLHNVVDVTGTAVINGGQVPVNITTPGQNAKLTFSGNQNQHITISGNNDTIACSDWTLRDPSGNATFLGSQCTPSFTLPPQSLSATGTYLLTIDPGGASTGSVNVNIASP